jgi:hypothetical protein
MSVHDWHDSSLEPTCSSTFCIEKSAVTLMMLLSTLLRWFAAPASLGAAAASSSVPDSEPSSDIHSSLSDPTATVDTNSARQWWPITQHVPSSTANDIQQSYCRPHAMVCMRSQHLLPDPDQPEQRRLPHATPAAGGTADPAHDCDQSGSQCGHHEQGIMQLVVCKLKQPAGSTA